MMERRDFLKTAGSLVVGFRLGGNVRAANPSLVPNAWVRVDPSGDVTLLIEKADLGQGVWTGLAMILADEMEADWARVRLEQAPSVAGVYEHTSTGGSSSTRRCYTIMRQAGAHARETLIAAAAETWDIHRSECRAENGAVIHVATGRRILYGDLSEKASRMPRLNLETIPLKDPKQFRLIGRPVPAKEIPSKVDGTAHYGIDVRVPGMLYAVVDRSPVVGGKPKQYDAEAAKAVPGVRAVVVIEPVADPVRTVGGVAVVADNTWAAVQGRAALKTVWDDGPNAGESSESFRQTAQRLLEAPAAFYARNDGDASAALAGANRTIEAAYELPFLAHAPMEPVNCTADVRPDRIEMWTGNQIPLEVAKAIGELAGLPARAIRVNNVPSGGAFGRRAHFDYPAEAWQVSKAVGKPVKLIWTREDDIRHDFFRQLAFQRIRAGIDGQGRPVAWTHRIVSTSSWQLFASPEEIEDPRKLAEAEVEGAATVPYAIPNVRVEFTPLPSSVPRAWWRSVANSFTAFAVECFVDELATAAGKDPYEYRMELLAGSRKIPNAIFPAEAAVDTDRWRNVLRVAAERGGWGEALPAGWGRGIAAHSSFESYVAYVVTVSVEGDGRVRVRRVVGAVDCGLVVNPLGAQAQIEGAMNFGLGAALMGEISIAAGRVEQSNFHEYRVLRIDSAPPIEVHFVESGNPPGGLGEPGVPPIAPALANAVFAATGKRIRRLPITPERVKRVA
jgi:isoquinoline 1-oxidoreductase beta subunit